MNFLIKLFNNLMVYHMKVNLMSNQNLKILLESDNTRRALINVKEWNKKIMMIKICYKITDSVFINILVSLNFSF